jgi:uncharacterized membrane protein
MEPEHAQQSEGQFTCPMHPEVRQDRPGNCPKCGMPLEPRQEEHPGMAQGERQAMAGDHREMIREMRGPWLWTNFTVIALGAWLITSPFTLGFTNLEEIGQGVIRITQERGLAEPAVRGAIMSWSDVFSGALLMVLGMVSLKPTPRCDFWGRWLACFVGMWLQFAPLVFWAPSPAAYVNDTLVGVFVIALTILVPMMPGMAHHMVMLKPGPEIPPGWTYNPSSWPQRAPLIALGFVGWFLSRYLAAYQLGYISGVWDPFFSPGTVAVLDSDVSRSWPISDAGLGAVAYTFEVLMGFMGMTSRWRSMPWMVLLFGILTIPLSAVSVVLIILQPVSVGTWCTLCLVTGVACLVMIPLAVDEVVAMCQFMVRSVRQGKPFWRTFWVGDTIEGGLGDARTPDYGSPLPKIASSQFWGVTIPWNLALSAVLSIWLLTSPAVFKTSGTAANNDHLMGAIALTVVATAFAEVTRAARFLNVLCGLWAVAALWLLSGFTPAAKWNDVIVGVALVLLSIPRGTVRERYGSWNRYIL